jgi:cytosine/adenosine deaminase-related metal-dependent hydrolase
MRSYLEGTQQGKLALRGARCAISPQESISASIQLTNGRITNILSDPPLLPTAIPDYLEINLAGFLIMPGLVNAHDHLEFSLFPRLGNPPYKSYIDWGTDIHARFPEVIAKHRAVPKELRLWWGGIRNLLCGVTTVSHHNPLWPELQREDFPVRVVHEYGWGHSLALGGDLRMARSVTPKGRAFIVHACEGVDEQARDELWELDRLELLDASAVLVHGLAIDREGIALMRERRASLVVCPSSNNFLFSTLPDMSLLGEIDNVTLGNDSPLTAEGDLLDEIRFAIHSCNVRPQIAYRMVTEAPAAILQLGDAEGSIRVFGTGDLIAVRDTNQNAADRMKTLSMTDVEFVMIAGRIQLASEAIFERLPITAKQGLESLWINGTVRWLHAPVKRLLEKTEEVLGKGGVRLGGRAVRIPT